MEIVYNFYIGRPRFTLAVLDLLALLAWAGFINVNMLQFCHLLNASSSCWKIQ